MVVRIPESEGFSAETLREFEDISSALASLFAELGQESVDFEIHEQSSDNCSVDFTILNFSAISPLDVDARLADILALLRGYQQFWCVRFWLYKPTADADQTEPCIWLEINKYGVAPYRGMKFVEIFSSMDDLYVHYWGRTFRQPG